MKRIIAPLLGMLSALTPLAAISLSISMSPWFSWTGSFLSDLGRDGISSAIFNSGLIAGGVLGAAFSLFLMRERFYGSALGLRLFALATVSLVFVGAFPVQTDLPHTSAAVAFFGLSTASLLLIGYAERKNGRIGAAFLLLGAISLAALPLYGVPRPWGSNAFVEMLTSAGMSAFTLISAVLLLKRNLK